MKRRRASPLDCHKSLAIPENNKLGFASAGSGVRTTKGIIPLHFFFIKFKYVFLIGFDGNQILDLTHYVKRIKEQRVGGLF